MTDRTNTVTGHDGTAPRFGVRVSTDTTRAAGSLCGELDLATAPRARAVLDQLRRDGHLDVVLDLSQLEFFSIAGLRMLLRADEEFRAAGGQLTLVNPTPLVRRVLAITELESALTID